MYLKDQMIKWQLESGLKQVEIARKMGISRQGLYQLRKNPEKAGITSIAKYANACGMINPIIELNKINIH